MFGQEKKQQNGPQSLWLTTVFFDWHLVRVQNVLQVRDCVSKFLMKTLKD